jgi:hypothetical protein
MRGGRVQKHEAYRMAARLQSWTRRLFQFLRRRDRKGA